MTTRRWIIAVAVIGMVLAGEATRRRWMAFSAAYREEAERFEVKALIAEIDVLHEAILSEPDLSRVGAAVSTAKHNLLADHNRTMAKKYQKAASRPWLPVAADPPLPR
jgi:hypothetical protein